MKKSIFLSIAAAVLVFAGCAKEESSPIAKKGTFSIFASAPDTKIVNDGLTSTWSPNDAINLFHENPSAAGTFVSDGKFTTTGDGFFTGELGEELEEGVSYNWYAIYPYNSNIKDPAGTTSSGYITVGSSKAGFQTQKGNDDMAHLGSTYLPVYGKTSAAAGTTPEMAMHRLTSVVAMNVTNGTSDPLTVSEVTFTVAGQDIVGTYYINITGETPAYTGSGENYVGGTARLTVKDGEAIAPGSSAKFYFAIKPVSVTQKTPLTITVTDANGQSFIKDNITVDAEFKAGSIKTVNVTVDGFSTEKGTTADNPFTVAEAVALYEGTLPTNVVFVKGIISKIDEISTQHGNATYYISDDGTTAGQFEIFRGKYLGGANFTSTDQIGVGDEVIVKGNLVLYNTTKEMGQNNEIVSLKRVPYFTVNPEELKVASDGGTTTFKVSCKDDQEWEIFPQQSWVTCEPESGTGPATITVTVAANTGESSRDCDIDIEVGSGLDRTVSLTQSGTVSGGTEETITGTFTLANNKLSLTTESGITIVQEKGTSGTAPNGNYNTASTLRIYDGNTLTFSGKTITKIVFTHTASYNGGENTSANVGTYTRGTTSSIWEGEATSVTITNTKATGASNTQIRPTVIKVTYK